VIPTGIGGIHFEVNNPREIEAEYKKGREAWLASREGASVTYFSFTPMVSAKITEGYSIGYRYRVKDLHFTEKSYYVICRNHLFQMKSTIPSEQEAEYSHVVENILQSFTCE
jgi:hypothetical protein